jgi:4-carboxymuconolactone decarboxylase
VTDSSLEKGMAVRRAVLGDTYVDRAKVATTEVDADFQNYITASAWGAVWGRDHLTRRERSLVTIAMLAALGHHDELALHLQATRNTGASLEDVREVLMQVAVYAGVPAANTAFKLAKAFFGQQASDTKASNEKGSMP